MILDFVLRAGVVVAVIVTTKRLDIWDSSDESIKMYTESRDRARPYAQKVCQYLNIYVPQLPPEREKSYLGIYYYNQTVMTIFNFLSMCPTYVSMVLDKVPRVVSEYGKRAQEAFDEYQKQRIAEKEKKSRKIMIDDKTLVVPLEPPSNPECKCEETFEKTFQELVPKNENPTTPHNENSCIKSSLKGEVKKPLPETKCKCPKCDRRQAEGWLDNKTRCPRRDPCARQFDEAPRKCNSKRTRIVYTKGSEPQAADGGNYPSKDFNSYLPKS